MLSDRIELHRQLAETQQRAERAEAACAAQRATLRAIESETADSYDLFEQRVLQRVREALAAPDPGADLLAAAEAALDWLGWDAWCEGPTCPWGRGEVSEVREGEACEGCRRREGLRVAVARAKGEAGR